MEGGRPPLRGGAPGGARCHRAAGPFPTRPRTRGPLRAPPGRSPPRGPRARSGRRRPAPRRRAPPPAPTSRARPSRVVRSASASRVENQQLGQRHRARHGLLERLRSPGSHERVGVLSVGQKRKRRLPAVAHERQRLLEGPPGSIAPRGVSIEAEHHLPRGPVELLEMVTGRRRPQGRHRIVDPELGEGDDVHVALHHHEPGGTVPPPAKHLVLTVELPSLVEYRTLR